MGQLPVEIILVGFQKQLMGHAPGGISALICRLHRPSLRSKCPSDCGAFSLLPAASLSHPLPTKLVLRPSVLQVRQERSGLCGSILRGTGSWTLHPNAKGNLGLNGAFFATELGHAGGGAMPVKERCSHPLQWICSWIFCCAGTSPLDSLTRRRYYLFISDCGKPYSLSRGWREGDCWKRPLNYLAHFSRQGFFFFKQKEINTEHNNLKIQPQLWKIFQWV